jgi:ABC-type dipeptide/oligopeptide/nickel transport system ATPase component
MIPLLQVEKLTIFVKQGPQLRPVVKNVSFQIEQGECVGIVGESGSGKSLTAQTIACLGHYPFEGSIKLQGECIGRKTDREKRLIRAAQIGMIFQDPQSCLNPTMKIGEQIREVNHSLLSKENVLKIMQQVGLPDLERCYRSYPHELSGGMCQRVMIAIAIARQPKLLIADEPTTALDVTTQAQILDLLKKIQMSLKTSILLISHDFGVIERLCSKVLVLHLGEIVEAGDLNQVLRAPRHPYTKTLLASRLKPRMR